MNTSQSNAAWIIQRAEADAILRTFTEKGLVKNLPELCCYCVARTAAHTDAPVGEVAYRFARTVSKAGTGLKDAKTQKSLQFPLGKDLFFTEQCAQVLRNEDASRVLDRPSERYKALRASLPDDDEVDCFFIPMFLGSEFVLNDEAAEEIKKHIMSDDTMTATKLASTQGLQNSSNKLVALSKPPRLSVESLRHRLEALLQCAEAVLYTSLCVLNLIGPGCLDTHAVRHDDFVAFLPEGTSLALDYANHVAAGWEKPGDPAFVQTGPPVVNGPQ